VTGSGVVEGVLVDRRTCARYGPWLVDLVECEYRRNGRRPDPDLARLLAAIDSVGRNERLRTPSDASAETSETTRPPTLAPSAPCSMTTGEAARELGVTPQRVRRLCATGRLRADRVRGNWLLSRVDVAEEVQARRDYTVPNY
jgi:excisionase family DNA binding protein